ncbi:MAG: TauD/TfdA dioxygenase family protein [Acidimicrobiales bacterium]
MTDTAARPDKSTTAPHGWDLRPLAAALGAEVTGVALADVDDREIAAIEDLLVDHKVLFFPGQHLNADDHVAFAARFGPLEAHPNLKNATVVDHPEIFELRASAGGIADEWHTDLTFMDSPSVMSVLNMVTCPDVGGDTMWTNLCLAYEALSPPMQELCDGLTALHDAHPHDRSDAMAIHPVVRRHPVSGKKVLYVNEHFTRRIVEMSHQESEALLALLTEWVKKSQFTVRYHWTEGTIGMWDNRSTQHSVLNDFTGERVIQRATVMGDQVDGVADARWEPRLPTKGGALTRHDRQLRRFLEAGGAPDLTG